MESDDKKRKRQQGAENESNDDSSAPPPYGSQSYWEERYKKLKQSKKDNSDPEPFHSWYFSYEELAPILLPLILGEGNEEESETSIENVAGSTEAGQEQTKKFNGTNDITPENEKVATESNDDDTKDQEQHSDIDDKRVDNKEADDDADRGEDAEESGSESEGEDDQFEEVDGSDEDEQDAPKRVGLAKDGPISILEVGCGDVPLGRDLAKGIQELESAAGVEVTNILKRVVCTDYSEVVIQAMQEEHREESKGWKLSIPLVYEVVDARKMPYPADSFDLLIEKGTLDAMLSDNEVGMENCKKIVGECARVLAIGGYFVIVSHLNAHAQKGLQWLDDVVVPGLRKGGANCKWQIEVHGNDADVPSDREEGDDDEEIEDSHGPAVYVIQKCAHRSVEKEDDVPHPIDLRFFSY